MNTPATIDNLRRAPFSLVGRFTPEIALSRERFCSALDMIKSHYLAGVGRYYGYKEQLGWYTISELVALRTFETIENLVKKEPLLAMPEFKRRIISALSFEEYSSGSFKLIGGEKLNSYSKQDLAQISFQDWKERYIGFLRQLVLERCEVLPRAVASSVLRNPACESLLIGYPGLFRFSRMFFCSNLRLAYQTAATPNCQGPEAWLRWGLVVGGSAQKFKCDMAEINSCFDAWKSKAPAYQESYTTLPANLQGIYGYIAYAEARHRGNLSIASQRMRALCIAADFDIGRLTWGPPLVGSTTDLRTKLLSRIGPMLGHKPTVRIQVYQHGFGNVPN